MARNKYPEATVKKILDVAERTFVGGSGDPSLMKWELGCPAMVTVIQVARNVDTSAAYLQIKIENLSADILNSIFGVAHIDDIDGSTDDVPFFGTGFRPASMRAGSP